MKPLILFAVAAALSGCSQAVQVVRDEGQAGVVTYVYKAERGAMFSPHRREALQVIAEKCPKGYKIVREGQAKTQQSVGGVIEGDEDAVRRRWGLQYECTAQ